MSDYQSSDLLELSFDYADYQSSDLLELEFTLANQNIYELFAIIKAR